MVVDKALLMQGFFVISEIATAEMI